MTTVTCHCPMCGTISHVTCDEDAYDRYVTSRTPIQEIFPNMDLHTREILISGMCLDCQRFFFEEDDDDCNGACNVCCNIDCPSNVSFLEIE